ncbi:MAG: T9SS type A sorting domain-containing protein [Bacteroidota bacterium]
MGHQHRVIAHTVVALHCLMFAPSITAAQPSGPGFLRHGIINRNRVITVFGNGGVIGQPATTGSRGAWIIPSNGYLDDQSILIGLELPIRDYNGDGGDDIVHSVITCDVTRFSGSYDRDPRTGQSWTFEPDSGYCNPTQQSPALRSQPSTWPASWSEHPSWGIGTWDGFSGPDSVLGDDEAYFRMDDRTDERFNVAANNPRGIVFHPDSNDFTRMGQGISVGVRYVESADHRFQDVLYRVYEITNEGTTDYAKVVFGTLTGTYIGITTTENYGEYANDASAFFASSDMILSWNVPENKVADPLWQGEVGKFGEAFVETPAGDHIASYDGFAPNNFISLGDDESLWGRLKPGRYVHPITIVDDTVALSGEDVDYLYGSNYFTLGAGETKRVVSVLVYGYQKEEIKRKILLAKALWNSRFDTAAVFRSVTVTNFPSHRFLSGPQTIEWTTASEGGSVSIWYSPDAGGSWYPVAGNIANTGGFLWDTGNFPDGAFGLLRVVASDSSGRLYGFHETASFFTVNNHGDRKPFIRIVDSSFMYGAHITDRIRDLPLLIGTPSWDSVQITLLYRTSKDGRFTAFKAYTAASDTSLQMQEIAFDNFPNSPSFQIMVRASNDAGTCADSTPPFDKETPRPVLPEAFQQFRGNAQVPVHIFIQDSTAVRNDLYVVTFCDTAFVGPKTFSVRDSTRHQWVQSNVPFAPGIESAPFDGMTFDVPDFQTAPDTARTRWNRVVPGSLRNVSANVLYTYVTPGDYIEGYRQPSDYRIVFEDGIVDTTAPWLLLGLPALPVNYRVYNMRTNEKVKLAAVGSDVFGEMVFLEIVCGAERPTWDVSFYAQPTFPGKGDTLYLVTKKGLSLYDTLTIEGVTLSVGRDGESVSGYALDQNYPNPFNPTTVITGEWPVSSDVHLVVYDILGRKVATVTEGRYPAGRFSFRFDGNRLASGIYFYRLTVGHRELVRKMLLLR